MVDLLNTTPRYGWMTSIEEASGTPNEEFKTYYGNPRFAAKFVDGLKDYVRGKSVTITTGRLTEIEELGRYLISLDLKIWQAILIILLFSY